MANTTEMLRLMRHAADRLAEEKQRQPHTELLKQSTYSSARLAILHDAASLTAALTLAETVLRMVAAAMDDEPPSYRGSSSDDRPGVEPVLSQELTPDLPC